MRETLPPSNEANHAGLKGYGPMFDRHDGAQMAHTTPRLTRWLLWLFARRFNHVAFRILSRAYERGIIDSHQMHALLAHFDPTQHGTVGIARNLW